MANYNSLMRKLQTAILCFGRVVKINTRQFHSEEQNRMVTSYSVTVPAWSEREKKMVDKELLKTCSTVEVVRFLADMREGLENGAES